MFDTAVSTPALYCPALEVWMQLFYHLFCHQYSLHLRHLDWTQGLSSR